MPAKHPIKTLPPREYLLACFNYDPATGALTWKQRPRKHFTTPTAWASWNARFAGQSAGSNLRGYLRVKLLDSIYQAHRIIWKWTTGDEPPDEPDHINGDKSDNRWENLRPATHRQQTWNIGLRKNNRSGFRGVYRRASGRFSARVWMGHTWRNLKTFDTAEEAAAVAEAARQELHGEFFRRTL